MSILNRFFAYFKRERSSKTPLFIQLIDAINSISKKKRDEIILLLEEYLKERKSSYKIQKVKLNSTQKSILSRMERRERVAILFIFLDREIVTSLLSKLSFKFLIEVSASIYQIKSIQKPIVTAILEEFYVLFYSSKLIPIDGENHLREILEKTFTREEIKEILEKIKREIKREINLEHLKNIDSYNIANFLKYQHPQVRAVILVNLPESKSAKIISYFSNRERVDTIIRIANLRSLSNDIIVDIFKIVEEKLSREIRNLIKIEGFKKATKIISFIEENRAKSLLKEIKEIDFNLATSLNEEIFTFNDILKLNNREIKELLRVVDRRELAIALKGAVDEIKKRFILLMDKKEEESFYNMMFLLGSLKVKEIERAKRYIIKEIYRLSELGIISYPHN